MGMAHRSDVTFFIDGGFCTLTEYVGIILIKHAVAIFGEQRCAQTSR
jgi:hypothetical protein